MDYLKYFDWFLIKTDEQGIMTSQSKALLQKEIIKSQSFILEKKWLLKDKSRLSLYRRKNLNSHIEKKECRDKNQFLSILKAKSFNFFIYKFFKQAKEFSYIQ